MHNLVSVQNATVLYTLKWVILGNSLVFQLLGLHLSIAGGMGSIPGQGTKQMSFNFMAAVTVHSDFAAPKYKVFHCFHCFPIYLP